MSGTMLTNPFRFGPAAPYAANGVNFDGSNDYLTRGADLTGNADGKKGIIYFRFLLNGGNGSRQRFFRSDGPRFEIERRTGNTFRVLGKDTGGSIKFRADTVATYTADSTWHSFLASWDMASAGSASIYVDDTLDYNELTFLDANLDYTTTDHGLGADAAGGSKINACLADFYFNMAEYLDFSVTANRRKFTDASDKPVDLGSDGSIPTGTAPIIFFSGVTSTWHTNKGSGGGFTENGALTDCGTDP